MVGMVTVKYQHQQLCTQTLAWRAVVLVNGSRILPHATRVEVNWADYMKPQETCTNVCARWAERASRDKSAAIVKEPFTQCIVRILFDYAMTDQGMSLMGALEARSVIVV
jgi:hypothetical protein